MQIRKKVRGITEWDGGIPSMQQQMYFKRSRCLRERVTVHTLGIPLPFSIPSADLTRNHLLRVAAAVGRVGVLAGASRQQAPQVATSIST